jgi:hypothetical protein
LPVIYIIFFLFDEIVRVNSLKLDIFWLAFNVNVTITKQKSKSIVMSFSEGPKNMQKCTEVEHCLNIIRSCVA